MLKREELADPNSCFNKAKDDEPIFVLLARDPIAAEMVLAWSEMARGFHSDEKIVSAAKWSKTMNDWRIQQRSVVRRERMEILRQALFTKHPLQEIVTDDLKLLVSYLNEEIKDRPHLDAHNFELSFVGDSPP